VGGTEIKLTAFSTSTPDERQLLTSSLIAFLSEERTCGTNSFVADWVDSKVVAKTNRKK
jgi:hypothetical protein